MKQNKYLWGTNRKQKSTAGEIPMKGLWNNILGMILSLCLFGWGSLSTLAGLSQEHAGPVISGSAFITFGALIFGLNLSSVISKIRRR
jgi:hypothetical protein